uniref:Uncharacterized protein n=1 Tax=Medicago truncatula TaxID=3880 RepID=A2Q4A4_MEDTR|nr:hypothetical protein MtrDRAFT_AC157375g27v1 [Medicago truncatula]
MNNSNNLDTRMIHHHHRHCSSLLRHLCSINLRFCATEYEDTNVGIDK